MCPLVRTRFAYSYQSKCSQCFDKMRHIDVFWPKNQSYWQFEIESEHFDDKSQNNVLLWKNCYIKQAYNLQNSISKYVDVWNLHRMSCEFWFPPRMMCEFCFQPRTNILMKGRSSLLYSLWQWSLIISTLQGERSSTKKLILRNFNRWKAFLRLKAGYSLW